MSQATCEQTLKDAVDKHRQAMATTRARVQAMMTALQEAEASFLAVEVASAQVLTMTEIESDQVESGTTGAKRPRQEVATSRDMASSQANSEVTSETPSTEVDARSQTHAPQLSASLLSLPSSSLPPSAPPQLATPVPLPPSVPPSEAPVPPPTSRGTVGMSSETNVDVDSETLSAWGHARAWLDSLVQAVSAAAAEYAPRVAFGGRTWHAKRTLCVSDTLPRDGASMEIPRLLPVELAVVHAEAGITKDTQALRATGSPPAGVSPDQAAKLLLSGACDERLAITGLRNMFMQSGVPAAMCYEMISIPPNGLCVWLVLALLTVRCDARREQRIEPRSLTSGVVLDALQTLHLEALARDRILPDAIARIGGADRDASWDQISGERTHCGNIHEACEALAAAWGVHVPVLVLARHESLDAFSIAALVYGEECAPSIFGTHGGALVTYEASNNGGPLLSHVDMLVSSTPGIRL